MTTGGVNTPVKIIIPMFPNREFYGPTVFNAVCAGVKVAIFDQCSDSVCGFLEDMGTYLDEALCFDVEESIEL